MNATPYAPEFYEAVTEGSIRSANVVVPIVLALLGDCRPKSVVDAGCGAAAWLSVFRKQGIEDVLGLDGDYVPASALAIPPERFRAIDLKQPFTDDRRFDLAMSLEVAEHLPAHCAQGFVKSLCRLAPIVLFSAAIPGQGGTDHVNEQWPWYWRHFFAAEGFRMFDPLRPIIFHDRRVEWWYRQNLFLYIRRDVASDHPALSQLPEVEDDFGLMIVGPQIIGPSYYRQPGGL